MKKLIMMVVAVAFVLSFLPKAEAGDDTAQLGLKVAFDLSYPQEIDVLAKAVADHAFDINGDGVINIDDMHLAKDAYMKAIEYQAYLPVDIFGILDKNGDRKIDEQDWNLVYQEIRVYWIGNDVSRMGSDAYKIYLDAVNSGNPEVIKTAIDSLRSLQGDIKALIAELVDLAQVRPDLYQLIDDTIQKAKGQFVKIDGYIMELLNILYPLKIWSEPAGPFTVIELEKLEFRVIAEDANGVVGDIVVYNLPEGAQFLELVRTDPPATRREGMFLWTPKEGQSQGTPYDVTFYCRSDSNGDGASDEEAKITVSITVKPVPVISIKLVDRDGNPVSEWLLEGIRLGEKRDNLAYFGASEPVHHIRNAGNVEIGVDIGYGPMIASGIQPGINQEGLDTFITGLGRVNNHIVLEPNGKLVVGGAMPGDKMPLWLTYGAPKALSSLDHIGHGATYELRAYEMTIVRE